MKKLAARQEFKFAAIGGANTILDVAILFGLTSVGVPTAFSNIFSTGVTFALSFFLNKKITFKSEGKTRRELLREMILFTVVTLFGLWVIQGAIIWAISPVFASIFSSEKIGLLASKIIATIFSMIWNFVMYQRVVFKKSKKSA